MGVLIADSGSTKTDWRYCDDAGKILQAASQGIHPMLMDPATISGILATELPVQLAAGDEDLRVFFYGAGCKPESAKQQIRNVLSERFRAREITVESDLLGAARSLLGNERGIAAILGTGSNTCVAEQGAITQQIFSKGFILGDEGSGADLGKTLLSHYLDGTLPATLRDSLERRLQLTPGAVIESVYRKPMPNRYLAGFSKFIYQNLKDPFCEQLVIGRFRLFFERQVCCYPEHQELPFACTGSVGFYFSNLLRAVALEKNIKVRTITETPVAGLTLYHCPAD